ncbi:hypothetical protein AAVH_16153 [Aphelenchoides avenae]|nr:hypothetical protein AAVH_16153 [Aphelenchus avenae]
MDVDDEGGTHSRSEAGRRGGQARQKQMRERGEQLFGGVDPSQAGRKGAEARWGKESGATVDMDEEPAGGGSHVGGRQLREIEDLRELARWYGYEDVGEAGSGQVGRMTRSQAGQKGAAARWGKEGLEPTGTGVGQRGGMSRQEAGKKGAEARFGGKAGQQSDDMDTDQNQKRQMFGGMGPQEAGRKGAKARAGRRVSQGSQSSSHGLEHLDIKEQESSRQGGRHRSTGKMSRSEIARKGGLAAAANRRAKRASEASNGGEEEAGGAYGEQDMASQAAAPSAKQPRNDLPLEPSQMAAAEYFAANAPQPHYAY